MFNLLSNLKFLRIVVFSTSLFIIFLLILLVNVRTPETAQQCPVPTPVVEKCVKQTELPLNISILQNPIVYEWRASVEGALISRTANSFILEKNGSSITVSVKDGYTKIYKLPSPNPVLINNVQPGTLMRGSVLITTKSGPQVSFAGDFLGELFYIPPK